MAANLINVSQLKSLSLHHPVNPWPVKLSSQRRATPPYINLNVSCVNPSHTAALIRLLHTSTIRSNTLELSCCLRLQPIGTLPTQARRLRAAVLHQRPALPAVPPLHGRPAAVVAVVVVAVHAQQARARQDDERRGEQRQRGDAQQQLVHLRRHDAQLPAHGQQDERKLAHVRHGHAHRQRGAPARAVRSYHAPHQHALGHHQAHLPQCEDVDVAPQETGGQQQADDDRNRQAMMLLTLSMLSLSATTSGASPACAP
eukprot:CAMPEP_0202881100 /NCGR_PEP_ID=MMETSP1391-20130828/36040_1 /ASSEMBLY_ACC=CAM_ASM_000867 /TAXON_ID=1034604 /ORGANISM="Chlamydomonas leiostraca, Strain SAG 11-49" /LENGTH=256 /DNA_ID=CAMNT_0049563725 /DNA_START=242 /DNA_END=1011 /DNA_ORIENTATION=-